MSRRTQSHRPPVEPLEDRSLPSVCLVDSLTDLGQGQGPAGDLRYCVAHAHDGDSVRFGVQGTITLVSGELAIAADLTLTGPGAGFMTVSGNQTGRVFNIAPAAAVAVSGLTIADGRGLVFGGGIL